jgi:polyferredoxin
VSVSRECYDTTVYTLTRIMQYSRYVEKSLMYNSYKTASYGTCYSLYFAEIIKLFIFIISHIFNKLLLNACNYVQPIINYSFTWIFNKANKKETILITVEVLQGTIIELFLLAVKFSSNN